MPEWTKEQKNAIESRDGTILVSAAAGSGKTAVLVERVTQRLMDKANLCSADRLLIVTFTRAATKQMRERIYIALSKKLRENPNDAHLKHQIMILPNAKISTIDSFCNDIVRENFHEVDLPPDYKLIEGAQLKLIEADAMNKTLDEMYKENSDSFAALVNMLVTGTDDSALSNLILKLYYNSMAFARPEIWLNGLSKEYKFTGDLRDSTWGKLIIAYISDMTEYCLTLINQMQSLAEKNDTVKEYYQDNINQMMQQLQMLKKVIKEEKWDIIRETLLNVKFNALKRLPKDRSCYETEYIKNQKKQIADYINKKAPKYFCATNSQNDEDIKFLRPIVEKLISIVIRFGEIFKEKKLEINGVDFSDISHLALKLLVNYDDNDNIVRTDLAKSISSRYDEILVDEFQDINEIQNTLFYAISNNNENMFMVGDVKQSIYRFRQAMPEIFLKRRDELQTYVGGNYPSKITLDRNFRSRSGVTENVNFVFSQLMSPDFGGVDYSSSEALVAAADYDNTDYPQTEIHIIGDLEHDKKVSRAIEAQHIAEYINETIESSLTIKDGDTYRPIMYRDFCILMRSASGGKAEIYLNTLTDNGIPAYYSDKSGFFTASEVSTILNLMRVIDNPVQDIPLLAVMLSPIIGFTADNLAAMRIKNRKSSLYQCLKDYAKNGDKESEIFLTKLQNLRMLSSTLPCTEFIRSLYDETGYLSIVSAMKNGSQRRANLNLLIEYAQKFEDTGKRGLSAFIRFIDRIQKQDEDLESASDISETANVVHIMTIHKSKGLEFPVCILADLSARFNDDNSRSIAAFHPDYGICFDMRQTKNKIQYSTIGKKALTLAEHRSSLSEELRVLYVAMTRAKERLVCIARYDNYHDKINSFASMLGDSKVICPFVTSERTSMADWILLGFLRHPDAAPMRNELEDSDIGIIKSSEKILVKFVNNVGIPVTVMERSKEKHADEELLNEIRERTEYEYPYSALKNIRAKSAPSQFDKVGFSTQYFACARPEFLSKSGVNPASRGTATHKFMEFYDYNSGISDIEIQAQRMVDEGHMTSEEAAVLEKDKLERFFSSTLADRIRNSDNLMREKKVTFAMPAGELYNDLPEIVKEEKVIIQGYVDCAFENEGKLVIVDYKTDRGATMEELRERYHTQLKLYERALAECTQMDIEGTLIYSFENGEYIKL